MNEVQNIFPEAYENRYSTNVEAETYYLVNLAIGNSNSITSLSLYYDPSTNKVTEININYQIS